jgi:excisionase family DNA binding protein
VRQQRNSNLSLSLGSPPLPHLLTTDEVAQLLRTSRKVVYEMIRLGQLPGVIRMGRKVLVRRDRLLEFILEREEQPVSSLGGKQ